jgi:hypothetical protein
MLVEDQRHDYLYRPDDSPLEPVLPHAPSERGAYDG